MFKNLSVGLLILAILVFPASASAHVTVKPATVNPGEFTTFTVSVPNEKDQAVVNVKLEIPKGLNHVTPTVKQGWTVTTEKTGSGKNESITSITWTAGSIAAGFRDDFTFSAQAPAEVTKLNWKAYQTYADGTVASWNQSPSSTKEKINSGPYSTTEIVDDLEESTATSASAKQNNTLPLLLSLLAVVISVGGLLFRKKT